MRASLRFKFEDCVFDTEAFELKRHGKLVDTTPQVLTLLKYLLDSRNRLVSKDELVDEIWGGRAISDAAITVRIGALRQAIGDTGERQRLIRTTRGRGFRFVGKVSWLDPRTTGDGSLALAGVPSPAERALLPDDLIGQAPKIAVLPFTGDRDLSGLAQALPADVIVALSRLNLVRVNAQSSSFLLHQSRYALADVRSMLGADYMVAGSVVRAGDDYLVYAELVDSASQDIVWADSFEVERRDIHATRADIVNRIVARAVVELQHNEAERLALHEPDSLTAWQAFHIGMSLTDRRGKDYVERARRHFERAVQIDPGFARAWAGLSNTYLLDVIGGRKQTRRRASSMMIESAERAMESDPEDASANRFTAGRGNW